MSTNFEDLIGRGVTGSKPAAGIPGRLYYDTTTNKMNRDNGATWDEVEGAGGAGDITYAALQACQLINEIKGWPPVVNTGDLDALNLWWDKLGTPTTAPTIQDTSAAGLTDDYELCMKVVADGANEGLFQRFTYADEPRVKAGRYLSTLWAIWCVGGVGVTLSLLNQTSEETAATKVTAAAWTIVEVPNHLLAGTYVDVILKTDGAGTFYAVPLGANIGARGFPLPSRPSRRVDIGVDNVVNGVDPGGAGYTDLDLTSSTSPLAHTVEIWALYKDSTNANKYLLIRRNGSVATTNGNSIIRTNTTADFCYGRGIFAMDDGQVVEWTTGAAAGDTELVYINTASYWEWA